jgi:hypothetical protein
MQSKAVRKAIAYSFILVSSIAYGLLPVIPFLEWTVEQKTERALLVFAFAQITWWLGVPLLGKEFIQLTRFASDKCRSWLGFTVSRKLDNK